MNQISWDQHCNTLLTASKGTFSYGGSILFTKAFSIVFEYLLYRYLSGNDFHDVVGLGINRPHHKSYCLKLNRNQKKPAKRFAGYFIV